MTRPLPSRAAAAALIAALLFGLWPYLDVIGWLPWGGDALKWVGRSSVDNPDWARWVFGSKHFVGYRPVTALSYTLNSALTGYSPYGYRVTDLGFYALSLAAMFALYRRLTGDRSVLSVVPLLLVAAHPATEEIVPFSSRRSYLMAAAFGFAGLTVLADAARSWARAVGGAALLGLAVLSNEVAYVLVPLVPWVVGRSEADGRWRPDRRWIAKLLPAAVVVGAAVIARYVVLGTIGGYQRRIFAFVRKGTPMWQELTEWRPLDILTAAWSHTVEPFGVTGRDPLLPGALQGAFAAVVAVWVAWVGLVRPLLRPREPGSPVALALTAWMAGSLTIVVLSQTWFWRQAHAVLVPLAMLVALELERALARPDRRKLPGLLVIGALALAVGWNGPLFRGLHRAPHLNTIQGSALARRMVPLLDRIDPGATVYLVAPLRGTGGHVLRQWGDQLGVDQDLTFHLLAHLKANGALKTADLKLVRTDEQRPRLFLGPGMMMGRARGMPENPSPGEGFDVVRLWRAGRPTWLVALDEDDAWAIRVPQPPPGVPTLADPDPVEVPDEEGAPAE